MAVYRLALLRTLEALKWRGQVNVFSTRVRQNRQHVYLCLYSMAICVYVYGAHVVNAKSD